MAPPDSDAARAKRVRVEQTSSCPPESEAGAPESEAGAPESEAGAPACGAPQPESEAGAPACGAAPPASGAGAGAGAACFGSRVTQAGENAFDSFKCSISRALPVDPVTAEDGHIYERAAIEKHFETARAARSPMTRRPMGGKLLKAHHVRSAIESAIASGLLPEEVCEDYATRKEEFEKEKLDELKRKASNGDAKAALEVARNILGSRLSGDNPRISCALTYLARGSLKENADGRKCKRMFLRLVSPEPTPRPAPSLSAPVSRPQSTRHFAPPPRFLRPR